MIKYFWLKKKDYFDKAKFRSEQIEKLTLYTFLSFPYLIRIYIYFANAQCK